MSYNQSNKGKSVISSSNLNFEQLNQQVHTMNLDSQQDSGWEVICKKNKNKAAIGASASSKQGPSQPLEPNSWRQADRQRTGGRGTSYRPIHNNYNSATNTIPPPLHGGWQWNSRRQNSPIPSPSPPPIEEEEDGEDSLEELEESDDDYDTDKSPKSHEERKMNRWFANFFKTLDTFTVDQINEPTQQWHCPACANGPGSIAWYCGLQSLVTHAKTKGSKRVKLHRDLAAILEEELCRRGTTVVSGGESFGQWETRNAATEDKEIVWPPMVVIMNTQLRQEENEKWVGMGNKELLDCYPSYKAVKARHSYGPKGHRGMSILIFESTPVGYTNAQQLSKLFEDEGRDRDAWVRCHIRFYPGGKRPLYGYMATKEDMDIFNQHSQGKSVLKFELVSYQEKVVNRLNQMEEDNQQLIWLKEKVVKEQTHAKALEMTQELVTQKLRKSEEEKRIYRERTHKYTEELKEAMDYQEEFFKSQLKVFHHGPKNVKEGHQHGDYFPVDLQERMAKVEGIKEFEEEREMVMKVHEEKMDEVMRRHEEEVTELKESVKAALNRLIDKYTPQSSNARLT